MSNHKKVENVRVLLCDDQMIVGEALRQMFEDLPDFTFQHILSADHIAAEIESFSPNVILQDLVLAECSGIDVLRKLRTDSRYQDLPVIILSTTDDSLTKYDAFQSGATDYIVKFPEKFELVGRLSYHSRAYLNLVAREQAQSALMQKSRLESLGNLSAGIAHEINTPLQYISTNLSYLEDSLKKLSQTVELNCDLIDAVSETSEGVDQISKIVRAMKAFAHPGKQEHAPASLNEIIADVATLSKNEWKECATLELALDSDLEPVSCAASAIAQVILNLVVNAAHAVKPQYLRDGSLGSIQIFSRRIGQMAEVEIKDNGVGIADSVKDRVFEQFFTTKQVGEGSGQGLSLARSTVVDGHKGEITFKSTESQGTSFFIRLPINPGFSSEV